MPNKINLPVQKVLTDSIQTFKNSKSDQEKAGALNAALNALTQFQSQLDSISPALLEKVKKELEGNAKKTVGIDDLSP